MLMTTVAIPLGTLIWTSDAPRPVETLQAGETIIGFSPDTFSRVPVEIQTVKIRENAPCRQLSIGGRVVVVAESQRCPVFNLSGEWKSCSSMMLNEGDFVAVDRLIPVPASPITLPYLDADLTAQLDEDAVALSDALYDSAAYMREMEKRERRLALYELLGSFWDTMEWSEPLNSAVRNPALVDHYNALSHRIFGTSMRDPTLLSRIKEWIGEGASPLWRALPAWVWQIANHSISAFLRGYFDSAADFTSEAITLHHNSLPFLVGLQTLLGRLHIEATLSHSGEAYTLTILNVRRYAEWIHSSVSDHAALLKAVYAREPRYPSDSTAHLPLNVIRPALERIRNRHGLPPRTSDTLTESEATRLENLRLLATAFQDSELRDAVNQQLYLEPVISNDRVHLDTLFILSLTSPATVVANGVVIGGSPLSLE